jgi:hypothetical protein
VNPATRRLAAAMALGLALAACDPAAVLPTPTAPSGPADPSVPVATLDPVESVPPAEPSPTFSDTSPVVLDPSLLSILPESIDGFPITEAPDEAAVALSDPALQDLATALDAGVALGDGNLVTAWVIKLRSGALDDEGFRQWRDTYDFGACSAADGVAGHAEAPIGGRQTFITTCTLGLRTYHVWLEEQDLLVSASSIGSANFGEVLMSTLRIPS